MGIFDRLMKRREESPTTVNLKGTGEFNADIVGESHYQQNLERIAGGRTEDGCRMIVDAVLELENDNPHDAKAVRVLINSHVCGYLDRENARRYRKQLKAAGFGNAIGKCRAMIVGALLRLRTRRQLANKP